MGKYSDPDAPCASEVVKDRDGKTGACGHFIGDHGWDDPLAKKKDELDVDYVRRFNKAQKEMTADDHRKREDAALTRGACHAYTGYQNLTCSCTGYTDPKASEAEKAAQTAAQKAADNKEVQDRIDAAVAKALADERARNATVVP